MFSNIFIEKSIIDHPRATKLLEHFSKIKPIEIDQIENYWGRVKRPYLQKREDLNLYLGIKRGQLVKEAPDAYGAKSAPHFYFIHAYNCIYECQYCYLQGHFHSPDIVLFLNHEEIIDEIKNITDQHPSEIWFHAGEYSDSLALSHLTSELEIYFNFFANHPNAKLELRTKSVNTRELLKLTPQKNIYISFSLSPEKLSKEIDLKTPPLQHRLMAMKKLQEYGYELAIHFDPIYYTANFKENYQQLIKSITDYLDIRKIGYFSLGVVRFTKDVYKEFSKNYPDSILHTQDLKTSFDGKIRYSRPERMWMMSTVKELLLGEKVDHNKIYFCMEND